MKLAPPGLHVKYTFHTKEMSLIIEIDGVCILLLVSLCNKTVSFFHFILWFQIIIINANQN